MKIISRSIDQTIGIGKKIASSLKRGDVVALVGDLGSGKTVLTKGIAKGLGVKDIRYVNSPTFVIIKEHEGKIPLYHFDLYRIDNASKLDEDYFEEYFSGCGVTVVEWADKIYELLPDKCLRVTITVRDKDVREIELSKLAKKNEKNKKTQ